MINGALDGLIYINDMKNLQSLTVMGGQFGIESGVPPWTLPSLKFLTLRWWTIPDQQVKNIQFLTGSIFPSLRALSLLAAIIPSPGLDPAFASLMHSKPSIISLRIDLRAVISLAPHLKVPFLTIIHPTRPVVAPLPAIVQCLELIVLGPEDVPPICQIFNELMETPKRFNAVRLCDLNRSFRWYTSDNDSQNLAGVNRDELVAKGMMCLWKGLRILDGSDRSLDDYVPQNIRRGASYLGNNEQSSN
jgi:hypothetical protein